VLCSNLRVKTYFPISYNSKVSFMQNPFNENMEEKIGENEEDKFSPKMPNSMPIVIKSNYLQFQKRQHCLWFNGQFRKQCLQEYWNKNRGENL
jgi:hypothetical protein